MSAVNDLPADRETRDARASSVGGHPLDPGHPASDTRVVAAGVDLLPADRRPREDQTGFVGGRPLDPGPGCSAAQTTTAGVDLLPADRLLDDAQKPFVGGHALDSDQARPDTQSRFVAVDPLPGPGHSSTAAQCDRAGAGLVLIHADALNDIEACRIAAGNRLKNLTNPPDKGGKGLPDDAPVVEEMKELFDGLMGVEAVAVRKVEAAMKGHPMGRWMRSPAAKGIGLKQGARLLAAIGDPYWHTLEDRPRTVSELWAYSGLHVWHPDRGPCDNHPVAAGVPSSSDAGRIASDAHVARAGVAPRRMKGRKCNWSTDAKTRALLIVDSCVKQLRKPCEKVEDEKHAIHAEGCKCSPYRIVYDEARIKYRDRVHDDGTPYSDGHKDNMARRYVAKRIMRDLWRESKRLHEAEP